MPDLRAKGGPRAEIGSAERLIVNQAFLQAGHPPGLIAVLLLFHVSILAWMLRGPLSARIATAQPEPVVAAPVLARGLPRAMNGPFGLADGSGWRTALRGRTGPGCRRHAVTAAHL